jgi:tryptophan halogenase
MIQKVVVLGGGSAGFLAAITLKRRLPDLQVSVIRSPAIGIIGVGEGTTFTIPNYLHGYLGIDPGRFHAEVRPTYKLGIRFLWGSGPRFHYSFTNQVACRYAAMRKPNGYYCREEFDYADIAGALMAHDRVFERQANGGPLVLSNVAYHLENKQFVGFLEKCALASGIEIIDGTLQTVEQDERGLTALCLDGERTVPGDLFIDCSGFRSELIGKLLGEPFIDFSPSLFCDRAAVGGWQRTTEPLAPYTISETMDAGWSWQIEHETLINRGYVYSSSFISDDAAETEFRAKNPLVGETRVVRFVTGRRRNAWVKNVVAIGNAAGFVEPLEATSIAVICEHAATVTRMLVDCDCHITPSQIACFNEYSAEMWSAIRRFLALHYRFNSRLDTPFWQACRASVDICGAEQIVEYYRANGPSLLWSRQLLGIHDPFGWEGYLSMLVGQSVPYSREFDPTPAERQTWAGIQRTLARRAQEAMPQEEALAIIRSPAWTWKPGFYQEAATW